MKEIDDGSVDLTVTSPPYDNLRTYNGNNALWGEHVWKAAIKGFLDDGAATKWYRLDKDIRIFDEKSKEHAPLSYKSGLIRAMPALPKITRLYISQMDGE